MIAFSVVCGLLIALALGFILPPLLRPDRKAAAKTAIQANVAVYQGQLAEMESDLRKRFITSEQFLLDREELEDRLVGDLPKESRASREKTPATKAGLSADHRGATRGLIYALAVALPLAAIFLYLALGTPPAR